MTGSSEKTSIRVRICCNQKQRYVGFFTNEIPQVVCQKHYDEKELLVGADDVIEIKKDSIVKGVFKN